MTEWDKLQNGVVYDDFSEELFNLRVKAKKLFKEYNKTTDDEVEKREILMAEMFASVGKNVWIEPDFHCEFGKNIHIGNDVYINFGCIIRDCAEVTIGNHVLSDPNLGIYPVNYGIVAEERNAGACISKPVHIEDSVWLGGDVKILADVTIGEGTVIGAGSVVTKNIPAGVIAAGNPFRVIRRITEKDRLGFKKELS